MERSIEQPKAKLRGKLRVLRALVAQSDRAAPF